MTLRSCALFLLVLPIIAGGAHAQSPEAPQVTVATVTTGHGTDPGQFVGRIQAVSTVALTARVEGFLEKRNFTEGGMVKKDDLLFTIEKGLYQANVDSAKATLSGAKATLKNSALNLQRQKVLVQKGDEPQSTADAAQAQADADKASVGEAEASLKTAEINLGYTDIRAPIDGRISAATVDVGNLVDTNSGALATLTSVDPMYVTFYMGEKTLIEYRRRGLISENSGTLDVHLTLSDGKPYSQTGRITYVDTAVQEDTDTVEIRATIPNPDQLLLPEQFVAVSLSDAQPKEIVLVPQPAVQFDNKGHFVYTVDGSNKVARQDVELGTQVGSGWEVKSGLKSGDKVVVQGLQRISPGMTVTPVQQTL